MELLKPASNALEHSTTEDKQVSVAVVGAGLSGLVATFTLLELQVQLQRSEGRRHVDEIHVFEATDRFGGM